MRSPLCEEGDDTLKPAATKFSNNVLFTSEVICHVFVLTVTAEIRQNKRNGSLERTLRHAVGSFWHQLTGSDPNFSAKTKIKKMCLLPGARTAGKLVLFLFMKSCEPHVLSPVNETMNKYFTVSLIIIISPPLWSSIVNNCKQTRCFTDNEQLPHFEWWRCAGARASLSLLPMCGFAPPPLTQK